VLQAVLFDFDGVLVETSAELFQGYREVFKKFRIDYQESEFNKNYGLKTKEHFEKVLLGHGIQSSSSQLDSMVLERDRIYRNTCRGNIKLLRGAIDLLNDLRQKGLKLGIASSTHRDNIDFLLPLLKIEKYFDYRIGGNEVKRGKPNPEGYLTLCNKLGIHPSVCAGIEDTDKGVQSLKQAGIKAIAVTLTNRQNYDFSSADLIVPTLQDLNYEKIRDLFK